MSFRGIEYVKYKNNIPSWSKASLSLKLMQPAAVDITITSVLLFQCLLYGLVVSPSARTLSWLVSLIGRGQISQTSSKLRQIPPKVNWRAAKKFINPLINIKYKTDSRNLFIASVNHPRFILFTLIVVNYDYPAACTLYSY